jgi:TRAP-type C4-dicarboxylate transport system substrate-binding protein
MNKNLFDSMPAEYQQILEDCAIEFQNNCVDYQVDYEQTAKAALQEKGIGIVWSRAE